MEVYMENLPDELIRIITNNLSFFGKIAIRLTCKQYSRLVGYFEINRLLMEDSIQGVYIPLNNIYIPFGLLLNWALNYPFLNYCQDNTVNRMPAYWMAIKCCTIYNRTIQESIIIWANKYRERYINN